MKLSNRTVGVLVLLGVLAFLTFGTAWILRVGPFQASDRGPVIATVDGEPVFLTEAQTRATSLAGVHSGDQGPLDSDEWPDQVLQSLIDDRLIEVEAERRGMVVTQQEMAASVQGVVDMFPGLDDYQAWLVSQNMDQKELERRLEQQLLGARVYDAVTAAVVVTGEQVRAYYDANPDAFSTDGGQPASFRDVSADIEAQLETEAKDAEFAAWLNEQRQQADVVVVMTDWWKDIR